MARLGRLLLAGGLLFAGCVTETTTPKRSYDTVLDKSANVGFGDPPPPVSTPPPQPVRTARGPTPPPTSAPHSCQAVLDEICGPLLLHYEAYSRLPQSLEELRRFKEFQDLPPFKCPVSGLPYTYVPLGVRGPDEELLREGRPTVKLNTYLVLSDPTPAHGGLKYAITVVLEEGTQKISLRVGILPK